LETRDIRLRTALLSVFNKNGLDVLVKTLHDRGVALYSTGGTADFIRSLNLPVTDISDVTGFPSILDGRVKTLHPKVFGGILAVRDNPTHQAEMKQHNLPTFDMVLVDLYPFEDTLRQTKDADKIIEKIDIGGIALIRAAAKNFKDVWVVPSVRHYAEALEIVKGGNGATTLAQRARFAARAFEVSNRYDNAIQHWLQSQADPANVAGQHLRYGENPHQPGAFQGDMDALFDKLWGKELSYNNLLDVDAALRLIQEFGERASVAAAHVGIGYLVEPTCAIIKHNNPCGVATRSTALEAWQAALAGDPTSAFGGIIAFNTEVDVLTARAINDIFFEVILAPDYDDDAMAVLKEKKNRIILHLKDDAWLPEVLERSALNGRLVQKEDNTLVAGQNYKMVTKKDPTPAETVDAVFAEKVCKHLKSNAIAIVKNRQLIGAGQGQTSRVDAVRQALEKAGMHGFDVAGAVLASDAFFPFADNVALAAAAGIRVVVQPGGSVRDEEVIRAAEAAGLSMIFTGIRHFRH
jgi:phosphoribosylaminoimidazolecarboxamide formyltransferase/IMP cyclohydrolase